MRLGDRSSPHHRVSTVIGLSLMLATLLGTLAACASTPTGPHPAPDAKQVFTINEKAPKNGDLVRLDPQQLYYQAEYQIAKEIFVGLLTLDQNGQIVPDGAAALPAVSADGLTYTFRIRSGLAWSDGTPITAQDFADAIARSQDPCINKGYSALTTYYLGGLTNELLVGAQAEEAMTCPRNANGTYPTALPSGSPIKGPGKAVEATDASTLVLRISRPAPYFLAALTSTTAMPVPKSLLESGGFTWSQEKLCQQPGMGSGPFKCVAWGHYVHLTLERNDRYYGGKAKIREIDYRFYRDTETPYADFKAGTGTLAYPPAGLLADARSLASGYGGFHQTPQVAVDYVRPIWGLKPFDNLDARIAFDAATDRVALASGALDGASAPTLHYIVPGLPGYNPNLLTSWGDRASDPQTLHGNLTAARAHMATYVAVACGGDITKCPPMDYYACMNAVSSQAYGNMLVGMWHAAFPGYPIAAFSNCDSDVIGPCGYECEGQIPPAGWIMDYPADQDWYDSLLEAKAGQNYTGINVPQADALVAQANTETDAAAAEALYRQAEQMYVNQVAWIVTDQILDTYVTSKKVVGYAENDAAYASPSTLLSFYILA